MSAAATTHKHHHTFPVLVIGGGGRENALVWTIARSSRVNKIYVSPGNGGTATMVVNNRASDFIENVVLSNNTAIVDFSIANHIGLVIVGPEDPLAGGLADTLGANKIKCFGPSQAAAKIESSKAYAKEFMAKHHIPSAAYQTFGNANQAMEYVESVSHRVVVKSSGLAAGKGVVVPTTTQEAKAAIGDMMINKIFGAAGDRVVIEEFLEGEEASFLAFTDGKHVVPMPVAQDHKRLLDGDKGPNTGGMGAFAPAPGVSQEMVARVVKEILQPAVDGMAKDGHPFVGVLYAGVMLTKDGPKNLEFNCRMGDPETQVILPLLQTDFIDIALACVNGTLNDLKIRWHLDKVAATVVMASANYPGAYPSGKIISGLKDAELTYPNEVMVFQAGTRTENSNKDLLVTSGGRVLSVTGVATSLVDALKRAYTAVGEISFEGAQYRSDIGAKKLPKVKLAVLGSTRGTDMQAIIDAIESKSLAAEIKLVVSNHPEAFILERAKQHNIPTKFIGAKGKTREQYDSEVLAELTAIGGVDLILLVGFMRIVSSTLINPYRNRILNVHPSLLPDFAGGMDLEVHEKVIAAGRQKSGCTIHFVDEGVDTGAVVLQKKCTVDFKETPASLKTKVQALEGAALVEAIRLYQQCRLVPLNTQAVSYKAAGVDIEKGDLLVEKIKPFAKSTSRLGADVNLGGFGALFDLARCYTEPPVLVSGTDGVGTKLLLAQQANKHDTIGIDLVAMCVNDVLAQGAEPLFFLDYFATGALKVEEAATVIQGIATGCKESGCALVGGETAEMPGMYGPGHYDLAGFCVGAVEKSKILPNLPAIQPGDLVIGLPSSGIHSNGFSLVRHLVTNSGADLFAAAPFTSQHARLVDDLLQPTRLYVKALLPSMKAGQIKAAAHITGGGLPENLPRVIPDNVVVELDAATWILPPSMKWLAEVGHMHQRELLRTFNCGLGMVIIIDPSLKDTILTDLVSRGERPLVVGKVTARTDPAADQVLILNADKL